MTKGKSTWKYNKLLTARRNYFDYGGYYGADVLKLLGTPGSTQSELLTKNLLGKIDTTSINSIEGNNLIPSIASVASQGVAGITGMINNIQSNDIRKRADGIIDAVNNTQMRGVNNDNFDTLLSDWSVYNPLKHVTAKDLGAKSSGDIFSNAFTSGAAGALGGLGLGPIGAIASGVGNMVTSLIGSFTRNNKIDKQVARINDKIDYTNDFNERSLFNRAFNANNNMMSGLNARYAANGGKLFDEGGYTWKDGLKDAASFLPIVGSGMDWYDTYKNSTWGNIGMAVLSTASDISGLTLLKDLFKATKFIGKASKALKASEKAAGRAKNAYDISNKVNRSMPNNNVLLNNWQRATQESRKLQYDLNKAKDMRKGLYNEFIEETPGLFLESGVNAFQQFYPQQKLFGGELNTQGADFTNGLLYINNGGSHESNPFEGVPIGIDEDGTPNLVEEGETIFNDYVFSNRLKIPDAIRSKYKLRGIKDMTFAEASKLMAKESEERPNDPISQRGLQALMMDLAMTQEGIRAEQPDNNKFAMGSNLKQGKYADWLRYAPAVGYGIGAITDAFGLTNKPDYSNADALLDYSKKASNYSPVSFNTTGNYLTYKPFDRNYYLTRMSAEAGATRRNIMNTSGGNRGTALSGLIAADNNFLNNIGSLARQGEEFNLAQRQKVEDFNRSTNLSNSQGILQAAMANQKAAITANELGLKGIMSAYQMRDTEKARIDAAKSANASGLFQTLGDIGFEEKNARMRDWAIAHGVFGPGVWDYGRFKSAKGGKIKRRKA